MKMAEGTADEPRSEHSDRSAKSLRKWLLLIWAMSLLLIWFSADQTDEYLPRKDESFGDPMLLHQRDEIDEQYDASSKLASKEYESHASVTTALALAALSDGESGPDEDRSADEEDDLARSSDELIEALQPITHDDCCIPKIYEGVKNPKDVICFGTCFNKRACDDPLYPFDSEADKIYFERNPLLGGNFTLGTNVLTKARRDMRNLCMGPKRMSPPTQWCQRPYRGSNENHGVFTHLVKGTPPTSCSLVTNGGGSGPFQHVLLIPQAKLAFCGIPKVGITQWTQFVRFVHGAKDYPSLPHYKLDLDFFQFDQMTPKVQREIWESDEWKWAAFLRDPAERALSGYLDKIKSKRVQYLNSTMTFERFIDNLAMPYNKTSCAGNGPHSGTVGLSWCSDPHFRPQTYSCGLSERLDRFDYIGDLQSIHNQTKELLEAVGLWDSYGSKFINGGQRDRHMCRIKSHPHNSMHHVGFQQRTATNKTAANTAYGHSKESSKKMDEYYSPDLLERVRKLYASDFELWKLVHGRRRLANGRELATQLSSRCK